MNNDFLTTTLRILAISPIVSFVASILAYLVIFTVLSLTSTATEVSGIGLGIFALILHFPITLLVTIIGFVAVSSIARPLSDVKKSLIVTGLVTLYLLIAQVF